MELLKNNSLYLFQRSIFAHLELQVQEVEFRILKLIFKVTRISLLSNQNHVKRGLDSNASRACGKTGKHWGNMRTLQMFLGTRFLFYPSFKNLS